MRSTVLLSLLFIVVLIPLGLLSRKVDALPDETGDALWAMMVFCGWRILLVRRRLSVVAAVALAHVWAADSFAVGPLTCTIQSDNKSVSVSWDESISGALEIPSTVTNNGTVYAGTSICMGSRFWSEITSVTIPNSVDSICDRAFEGCI